jgi:membrane protease YdiL (CAAX protease family)
VPDKVPSVDSFPPGAFDAARQTPVAPPSPWLPLPRWLAALQVFSVCGIPTGVVIALALLATGTPMGADGSWLATDNLSLEFFAMSSLFDTAAIALLIKLWLKLSGETSGQVFLGTRPVGLEALRGLALIPVLLIVGLGTAYVLRTWVPFLHNVERNPLEAYMDSPLRAAVFVVVVTLAGGVREELQRAFILHRFEQRLGGIHVGLWVWTLTFSVLHMPQGFDAAIAVGLLALVWGTLYIRRRSAVAAMVSHAGFNALQVIVQVLAR